MKQQDKPSLNDEQAISQQPQSYFKQKRDIFVRYIKQSQKEMNDITPQLSSNVSQKYSESISEVEKCTNRLLKMLDIYQKQIIKKKPEDDIQITASMVRSAEKDLKYAITQRRYYRLMISHFEYEDEKMRLVNSLY